MKMRWLVLVAVIALVVAACSSDDPAATSSTTSTTLAASTTSTTAVPVTTTTTTTTTIASGPPIAQQGDDNETVEAIQVALNCTGFGELTVDGDFGPGTLTAVNAAQEQLGRAVIDQVDEEMFAELSRACSEARALDGEEAPLTVVGNAAPGDPELFDVSVPAKGVLTVSIVSGTDLVVTVLGPDLTVLLPDEEGGLTWEVAAGDLRIRVEPTAEVTTFAIGIDLLSGAELAGAWIIGTDRIAYEDTVLEIGDDADTVIDFVIETLGHGVRGPYDEFDTGWYVITDPQSLGLRGLFIEGMAFLFFGPHPEDTDRPETLARIRFVGPSDDADGEPRPANYVTTAKGITVGDTLADLEAAHSVSKGGSDRTYYRFTDSNGELCFYFDEDDPADGDLIVEMSTECR
jgi:hypothetical protein